MPAADKDLSMYHLRSPFSRNPNGDAPAHEFDAPVTKQKFGSKVVPRWFQGGSKVVPRWWFQGGGSKVVVPRWFQGGSKVVPRWFQGGSKVVVMQEIPLLMLLRISQAESDCF